MEQSENFTIRPNQLGDDHSASAKAADTAYKVADTADSAVDRMASGAHAAVDRTADAVAQAAETLGVKGGQLKDLQEQWLAKSSAYVRDNPLKALGIAVVGGFLLSRLLSAR